jgi:hypothetical protein
MLLHQQEGHQDFDHALAECHIFLVTVEFKHLVHILMQSLIALEYFCPDNIFIDLFSIQIVLVSWCPQSKLLGLFIDLLACKDFLEIQQCLIFKGHLEMTGQSIRVRK